MNGIIITLDLDWACEPAIEETLEYLDDLGISPTVFVTHSSPSVEARLNRIEVGLHPYFAPDSSHGSTITEVVTHVMKLPHNIPAFRCHRFATCNASKQAMLEAGMQISSNVCTDLELVSPFRDRLGLLEVPIFLEDGGYLWRKHPLEMCESLKSAFSEPGVRVITIHPMHFVINTPHFAYMTQIKQSMSRLEWQNLSRAQIKALAWKGQGIKDLLLELIKLAPQSLTFAQVHHTVSKGHSLLLK